MKTLLSAVLVCSAAVAGHLLTVGTGTTDARPTPVGVTDPGTVPPPSPPVETPARLVAHEWGTFTSFSGSSGVPVGFQPNNSDLPSFVYSEDNGQSKVRLLRNGTVSMETPVIYFYADRETTLSARVDFPRGWITEWYPFAPATPGRGVRQQPGIAPRDGLQTIRWNVTLLPGETGRFPRDKGDNHYYHARETDAAAVQTDVEIPENERDWILRGGTVAQREKFLFYRGVGTFPPPVTVQALGGGRVRVRNAAGGRVTGMVLVAVRDGQVGFRTVDDLENGAEAVTTMPETTGTTTDLAAGLVKSLTAAGLYEKEARAMVKTWDAAWFREGGSRLLYLVPRTRTDELLPLTLDPKPTELVRVLVGRHDFLTPENEAVAERQLERIHAALAEQAAAEKELTTLGRFSGSARQMAEKRLEARTRAPK